MPKPAQYRLSLQDLLAAVTMAALAIGLMRFMWVEAAADKYIALFALLGLPASIGAAVGCLAVGWRRCWEGAIWGLAIVVCCLGAVAFLFGGLAPR
ncbi:MAG: hypothetical protein U0836_03635 [Pirellulales bacterium]